MDWKIWVYVLWLLSVMGLMYGFWHVVSIFAKIGGIYG
jgi:hypothetical protein